MLRMNNRIRHVPVLMFCLLLAISGPLGRQKTKSLSLSAANDARLLPFNGVSKKKIVESAADHNGSLRFRSFRSESDTISVVAFRIEFKQDTSTVTTGNGLFGFRVGKNGGDPKEVRYYNSDTVYKYDALPHDSAYFDRQLQYVRDYYVAVSRGKLHIDYTIFPSGADKAYSLDTFMTAYGPGEKKKDETYSEHNERINIRLLRFIRDAIKAADAATADRSPFAGIHMDSHGDLRDSLGRKTVFLIIHAGASYLTDGLLDGIPNTPYDMVDAFISKEYFNAYKDSLNIDTSGIRVKGAGGSSFVIDEIMMVSETANQDSVNFGIHGILIDQFARQIGIPHLYNTASAVSAVGSFCIMDFYGYMAGQGFVPPWPSAWVRAYMGWDSPVVTTMGRRSSVNLKALCASHPGDTTIALVPINDHEYYLLENRQRSLVADRDIFNYDTATTPTGKKIFIAQDFSLNLKNIVTEKSDVSREIMKVKNFDASLPASGVVVWHVDEKIIRDRLAYDFLNADSTMRAIALVEADGVNDIGFEFQNVANQSFFDRGGAEDVFPHYTVNRQTAAKKDSTFLINSMGPWSKPSTHANDGGQTYLNILIDTLHAQGIEVSGIRDYFVNNFIDSAFRITVDWDYAVTGWPKHTIVDSGEALFDPVVCDLYKGNSGKEIVAISKKGRLYVWPAASDTSQSLGFNDSSAASVLITTVNPTLKNVKTTIPVDTIAFDTVRFMHLHNYNPNNPKHPFTFPTVINNRLFIPLLDSAIDVVTGIAQSSSNQYLLEGTIIPLDFQPSSYVCKLDGNYWAIGGANGIVFCADSVRYFDDRIIVTLAADTPTAVSAIAAFTHEPGQFVCIQNSGVLSIGSVRRPTPILSKKVSGGIAPYTLATGDINHDDTNEIVVCDGRKGLWVFKRDLSPAQGWEKAPNDGATSSLYSVKDRASLPTNLAPVALADINGDGCLEIVTGGAGGLYAFNFKGNPITGWPSYLDNRFPRGNVDCSPAVVAAPAGNKSPLVVFSTPTGENETFEIDKIISTNKKTGIIVFRRINGSVDSTYATPSYIDSAIVSGDSIIPIVALYSGLIDAVDPSGTRPLHTIGSNQLHSRWPLSIGGGGACPSPLIDAIDGDGSVDIIATSANGWVYRWKSHGDLTGGALLWKQTGGGGDRSFAYSGQLGNVNDSSGKPLVFFSWPNPTDRLQTNGKNIVNFKFKFSGPAKNVRLDIFTYTGYHVFSKSGLSGSFPDWNSLDDISLANFGSGVYRCRMEAEVSGKKQVQYWKMAVVK